MSDDDEGGDITVKPLVHLANIFTSLRMHQLQIDDLARQTQSAKAQRLSQDFDVLCMRVHAHMQEYL